MARARVIHSDDAVMIKFEGNRKNPEPSTAVIQFPGGHVEVSRCSTGEYFAHIQVVHPANVVDSRIDYHADSEARSYGVGDMPHGEHVSKVAIKISNKHPHFDADI
jgi:hypothetical protein